MLMIIFGQKESGKTSKLFSEVQKIHTAERFRETRIYIDNAGANDACWTSLIDNNKVFLASNNSGMLRSERDVFVFDANKIKEDDVSQFVSQILGLSSTNRVLLSLASYEKQYYPLFARAAKIVYMKTETENIGSIPDEILSRQNKAKLEKLSKGMKKYFSFCCPKGKPGYETA